MFTHQSHRAAASAKSKARNIGDHGRFRRYASKELAAEDARRAIAAKARILVSTSSPEKVFGDLCALTADIAKHGPRLYRGELILVAKQDQAGVAWQCIEQERQQYRFKITKVGGVTKKEDRIRRLIPWFEHGKIWMPQSLIYNGRDLLKEFLNQEYASFPVARTDDMMDSLARLAEPDLKLPFPKEAKRMAALPAQRSTVPGMGVLG